MEADEAVHQDSGDHPDNTHSVPSDDQEPTATVDIPAGPESPSESSDNSDEEETGESDNWRSESFQQKGPRTPSPPRGPRTPSPPRGPRTPSPSQGLRTTPPTGPRTPSPAGPRTPPSPGEEGTLEETPASPVDSPLDSDEEENSYPADVGEPVSSSKQSNSSEHNLQQEDPGLLKFATDTPCSPAESSDSNAEGGSDDPSIASLPFERRIENDQKLVTLSGRPPSPPMPPPEDVSPSPDVKSPEQEDLGDKLDLKDKPPSPPLAGSVEMEQSMTSPHGSDSEPASPEPMEQVANRVRPPSPMSPPPESQESQNQDSQNPFAVTNGDGFGSYLSAQRRSPPPQISINTMDGIEFGEYREGVPHFLSAPPSAFASQSQSPRAMVADDEDSREPTRVAERVMASIRKKTQDVRIEDSDSLPASAVSSTPHSSELSVPEQPKQKVDEQSLFQKVVAKEKSKQEMQSEESKEVETNKDKETSEEQEQKQQDETSKLNETKDDSKTGVDEEKKLASPEEKSEDCTPSESAKPEESGEATDITLHPEKQDLELDDSKEDPAASKQEKETEKTSNSEDRPRQDSAAVVDVHHIDVHGDELDYEEDVEDHAKDGGKEDKEDEEEDEEGAIDDDLDEGEITVSWFNFRASHVRLN